MKTQTLPAQTPEELVVATQAAVAHLRRGEPVALPTETVYGLAADALDVNAALKIFEAKERPRFDPLIVHLPDRGWLARIVAMPSDDERLIGDLLDRFWPGPLSLILPRQDIVPDIVTAGLQTVAVRISAHPIFKEIIEAFDKPLAAPSANRFGRISPTAATHVADELQGRIPVIVDGGATKYGLESTIVAVRNERIEILRHGPITAEQLGELGSVREVTSPKRPEAPGQLRSHYAPRTRLQLTTSLTSFQPPPGRIGALSFEPMEKAGYAETRALSAAGNLREAAANLFRHLRALDDARLDLIVAEEIPEEGLGRAIMDRLRRAAARQGLRPAAKEFECC
ncbi:MAG: L-threonylcarbamoyladenylate synthase [Verrucomicrobiota bacterium]|nr:L-threonylcarbamoyladenylate synthase [Verrucomicrobiota bacterium]